MLLHVTYCPGCCASCIASISQHTYKTSDGSIMQHNHAEEWLPDPTKIPVLTVLQAPGIC